MSFLTFSASLSAFLFVIMPCLIAENESITSRDTGYREVCRKAAESRDVFLQFRAIPDYRRALEITEGDAFYDYLMSTRKTINKALTGCERLDMIGNPTTKNYPSLGRFSATTLRYIAHADKICKFFQLPQKMKVAEIGAGFGGQCFVLSQFKPFETYYIYDLPEVQGLIQRVMQTLYVNNVICPAMTAKVPEEKIDLVISNYAFSECSLDIQLLYFEQVIKKADRGYMVYNQISQADYGINSMSCNEFVHLLRKNGIQPKVFTEFLSTAPGNKLIIWDKTKS